MRCSLLFVLALAFIFSGSPATAQAASTDLKGVPSGTYELDLSHASIVFKVSHMGLSRYTGRFNNFDAILNFDSKHPEKSKLEVSIDPSSIDTYNDELQSTLKDEKNFNVGRFPQWTFTATKIKVTGPRSGIIDGNLTMFGMTQPIQLKTTFNGWGEHMMKKVPVLGFSATGALKRSKFGYTNMLPMIGDEVTFQIEAEFDHRAPQGAS